MNRWRFVLIFLGMVLIQPAMGPADDAVEETQDVLKLVLDLAGADHNALTPSPYRLLASSTQSRHLPFFRSLMADPLRASYRVGILESSFRSRMDSPHRLVMLTGSLAGADVARGYLGNPFRHIDSALLEANDPLATGLAIMILDLEEASGWNPALPTREALPRPMRLEIARMLAAIGQANRYRLRAFRNFPDDVTSDLLLRQAIQNGRQPFEEPDFRTLYPKLEREALMAGMLELVAALEDLDNFFKTHGDIPEIVWKLDTPLGTILVDTTGENNEHHIEDPLLVIDVGGDDVYHFTRSNPQNRISIVYDRDGDDHYIADGLAFCPSSAVMGYGILWDTGGDDRYEGGTMAQSAALFGATLLYDGGGHDVYQAEANAQAFATGGAALLVSGGGNDTFEALTNAQGTGGPEGAAILINVAGDDVYLLGNDPLIRPSAQLPDHNTSMGQGAGTGLRADLEDGRSVAGGIGALFDFEGDDTYTAQVFAQGAGFLEGTGILVDGGGNDTFKAAWYGMAASAHRAAGILISRGDGNDVYQASHYTSIGAAHDYSIAFFIDEGGNDTYEIRDLGIGAANENSTAIFVDVAGDDVYTVQNRQTLAFGGAKVSHWGTSREDAPNLGIFLDLGGNNTYNSRREGPANKSTWTWPRQFPDLDLRSEAGAGVDGEYPSPFHTKARTPPSDTDRKILEDTLAARRAWREDPRYLAPTE